MNRYIKKIKDTAVEKQKVWRSLNSRTFSKYAMNNGKKNAERSRGLNWKRERERERQRSERIDKRLRQKQRREKGRR